MNRQIAENEKKTWNLINLLNTQINEIKKKINEISFENDISKKTLDKYSRLDKEITQLKQENKKIRETK